MDECRLPADQRDANARERRRSRNSRRYANRRPAVAAHGVDGNVKGRGHRIARLKKASSGAPAAAVARDLFFGPFRCDIRLGLQDLFAAIESIA